MNPEQIRAHAMGIKLSFEESLRNSPPSSKKRSMALLLSELENDCLKTEVASLRERLKITFVLGMCAGVGLSGVLFILGGH